MALFKRNVLSLIKDQHKILKYSIDVLKDPTAEPDRKIENLERFIDILRMHSAAEEQTIYEVLSGVENGEKLIRESEQEHAMAKRIISELELADFRNVWNANCDSKAKALAELVEQHAGIEEIKLFELASKNLNPFQLEKLGEEFISVCEDFDAQLVPPPNHFKSIDEMPFR